MVNYNIVLNISQCTQQTLERVDVMEYPIINNDVVRVLLEAMNYSRAGETGDRIC